MSRRKTSLLGLLLIAALLIAPGCGKHDDHLGIATIHLKSGRLDKAIEAVAAAPSEIQNTFQAQMILGEAYTGKRDYERAIRAYERAAGIESGNIKPILSIAELEAQRSSATDNPALKAEYRMNAMLQAQRVLELNPRSDEAHLIIAMVNANNGRIEDSVAAFKKAIELAPDKPSHKIELARLHLSQNKPEEAAQLINEALKLNSKLIDAIIIKAQIIRITDKEVAKEILNSAVLFPDITPEQKGLALFELATLYAETGELGRAKEIAKELVNYDKYRHRALFISGNIALQEGDYPKAYNDLKKLDDPKQNHEILFRLAFAEENIGMTNQAVAHYQHIVDNIDPKYIPARQALMRLMYARQAYDETMKHAEAILVEQPGNVGALRHKALVHRAPQSAGYDGKHFSHDLAKVCYLRVLGRDASQSSFLDLAELYLEMNRPDLALPMLQRAATFGENATVSFVRGKMYLVNHNLGIKQDPSGKPSLTLALEHLSEAAKQEPGNQVMVLLLARAHFLNDQRQLAADILKKYVEKNPTSGRAHTQLASIYETMKRNADSIAVLEAAAKVPGIRDFDRSLLGRGYFLAGRRAQAIEVWQKILLEEENSRRNLGINVGLAIVYALEKQHQRAIEQAKIIASPQQIGLQITIAAACIAIQADSIEQAKRFVEARDSKENPYASPTEKKVLIDFIDLCKRKEYSGKQAAALICEAILNIEYDNVDAAVANVERAIQLLPESRVPYFILTKILVQGERVAKALDVYKQIFDKFPNHGYPHLEYASIANGRITISEILSHVEKAIELDPELAQGHILLAQVYMVDSADKPLEQYEKAVKHAEKGVEMDGGTKISLSTEARAKSLRAMLLQRMVHEEFDPTDREIKRQAASRATQQASRALQTLSDKFPNEPEVARSTVRFELSKRDFASAASAAQRYLRQHDDPELKLMAAIALTEKGDYPEAIKLIYDLLQTNPINVNAHRQLADIYDRMDRRSLAIAAMQRALQAEENIRTAFELARLYQKYGFHTHAAEIYRNIVKSIPESAAERVLAVRTIALLELSENLLKIAEGSQSKRKELLTEARTLLQTVKTTDNKSDPRALVLLGRIMELEGNQQQAFELYKQATTESPNYITGFHSLALWHFNNGQHDQAIAVYGHMIQTKEWRLDANIYTRMILMLIMRNGKGDAQKAIKLTDDVVETLSRQEQPESLEGFFRTLSTFAYMADQRYPTARAEAAKIKNLDEITLRGLNQLIEHCSSNPATRDAFVADIAKTFMHQNLNEFTKAIEICEKLNKAIPRNTFILTQLAALNKKGNNFAGYAQALELQLQALENNPLFPAPAEVVNRLYEETIAVNLSLLTSRKRAGLEVTVGQISKTRTLLDRALAKQPQNVSLISHYATLYLVDSDTAKAIESLDKITELTPPGSKDWLAAKQRLARIYFERGDTKKALTTMLDMEQWMQDNYVWLNDTAWYLATNNPPDLERAASLADRAKMLAPIDPRIRDTLGWIYHLSGKYQQAQTELEYAAQELQNSAGVFYHKGVNEFQLQRFEDSLKSLNKAIDLYNSGEPFQNTKECSILIEEVRKKLSVKEQ